MTTEELTVVFTPDDEPAQRLLDREDDLAALDDALAEAAAGAGRVLLIEGPAGIGKTALLDHLRRRAEAAGMAVLVARGGELERGFGFGVVRQLLEPAVVSADAAETDRLLAGAARLAEPVFTDVAASEETRDVAFATLHGLYWLVVNLTERGPLVLAVDDAQWADEPSLRFLLHLAHRLAGLPVVVALTVRTAQDRHRADLNSLLLEARPPIIRPRPLGESAVARLVRASLGHDASTRLCRACADATGGNPFLLSELLGEFRRDGRPAEEIDPGAVDRLGPERIATAVLVRVGGLHVQAPALARAVAVLGDQARLAWCAELAGVDGRLARTLATGLADLSVLVPGEPLRFVHPVVRTAIYADLSAEEQADLHARAARLLVDHRADQGAVAVHLLATTPSGDPAVVAMLREAARTRRWPAAPPTRRRRCCAARSTNHPSRKTDRPLLFELGNAEHEIGDPAAHEHLREAGETTRGPGAACPGGHGAGVDDAS